MSVRRFRIACILAAAVIVAGGGYYRLLASQYARAPQSAPLPPGTLATLPMNMGGWSGEDTKLDEAVIKATDTDDILNRSYRNQAKHEAVGLYVGYGIRLRDLMPHRPEVCYPGNGWTLERTENVTVALIDGTDLPCRILSFHRGGFSTDKITVLTYYIVDGEYCADVSALRRRAVRVPDGQSFSVQVQIVSSVPVSTQAEQAVKEFVRLCGPEVRKLMPDKLDD